MKLNNHLLLTNLTSYIQSLDQSNHHISMLLLTQLTLPTLEISFSEFGIYPEVLIAGRFGLLDQNLIDLRLENDELNDDYSVDNLLKK